LISRYADDFVCAFRFRSDAEWFYQVLPKRLGKFTLEVAPEKTRILRFSRFHPGMTRRFTVLGFECFWKEDRQGVPRVERRTARKKLQSACKRIKAWMQANRHLPGQAFFNGLNARLRGHDRSYGVQGNSGALYRFFAWAMNGACKGLHRRGGTRRSFSWARFAQILDANHIERPRITEVRRRRVFA
jgi:RNA-directed DNA polymerase